MICVVCGSDCGKPTLLDLFSGAGGAARGYQRAGFCVLGVDIKPQPRYAGDRFVQADAMTFSLDGYDAIHASPPCQFASRAGREHRANHDNLIPETQALLEEAGVPYVIENVQEARVWLRNPVLLCGSMFRLPLQSHRYFESSMTFWPPATCVHRPGDYSRDHGFKQLESVFRDAQGCEWMTTVEARQAIPPAYTEYIGKQLMAVLNG